MTDADKLISLAKTTLLVATRLNALEQAIQENYTSGGLWDKYADKLGLARSRASQLQQRREVLVDKELSLAIAELQRFVNQKLKE